MTAKGPTLSTVKQPKLLQNELHEDCGDDMLRIQPLSFHLKDPSNSIVIKKIEVRLILLDYLSPYLIYINNFLNVAWHYAKGSLANNLIIYRIQ
jgi:hypothetical protein